VRWPRWVYLAVLFTILLAVGLSLWAWSRVPERVAVHWDWRGQADGFIARTPALLIMPILMAGLAGLHFGLIPKIEPWRQNLQRFRRAYAGFGVGLLAFLLILHGYIIAWNLGWIWWDIRRILAATFALGSWGLANTLAAARPNWFFGIRTPWTLSSPMVWRLIHQRAAHALRVLAMAFALAVIWPPLLLPLIGSLLVGSAALVVYSFMLYRKLDAQIS